MADTAGSVSIRRMCSVPEKLQLHLAMVALQFGYAGFHVVSRAALNMGISKLVFPVYRNIIAFLLLLPFAYFLEKYIHHTNNPYYFSSSSFMSYTHIHTLSFIDFKKIIMLHVVE